MSNVLVTRAVYAKFAPSEKEVYLDTFGRDFLTEEVAVPTSSAEDLFVKDSTKESATEESEEDFEDDKGASSKTVNTVEQDFLATQGKYSVEGDRVYMNTYITIGTSRFKGPRVELTAKNMCLSSWDKDTSAFTKEECDVVNLIKLIRLHGADKVNELSTVEVNFAKEGDRNSGSFVDPIAAMMKAEAEAKAAKVAEESAAK